MTIDPKLIMDMPKEVFDILAELQSEQGHAHQTMQHIREAIDDLNQQLAGAQKAYDDLTREIKIVTRVAAAYRRSQETPPTNNEIRTLEARHDNVNVVNVADPPREDAVLAALSGMTGLATAKQLRDITGIGLREVRYLMRHLAAQGRVVIKRGRNGGCAISYEERRERKVGVEAVVDALAASVAPMTGMEICAATGIAPKKIGQVLGRMSGLGRIVYNGTVGGKSTWTLRSV